jgi:putative transposase
MVAAIVRTIFAQPDPAAFVPACDEVGDRLAASLPKIGPLDSEPRTRDRRAQ